MTKEAFEREVVALRKQLFYVSYSLVPNPADQEDAVQECIHKALRKRESLREDAYLKTWLIRILINVCHDMRKRRQREIPLEEIVPQTPPQADAGVFDAVMSLDEKLRMTVVLHYHAGYSIRETASILRIPEGTVKTRLMKARALLTQILDEREALA